MIDVWRRQSHPGIGQSPLVNSVSDGVFMASAPQSISIFDLSPEIAALWPELTAAIERVLKSGQFVFGPETAAFEREAAEFLGAKHAIAVNSGTDALVIGLRAMGIGPGDEVVTTPFSFFASAESISIVGAKPVFVDVELDSMNMDPDLIEPALTERTKAIMPVHLFGRPCSMDCIMGIAAKHGLEVIEDCAQSFGAPYNGRMTGTLGKVGCYSFFPTKNLGCYGDGGMLSTDDDALAELARKLRNHGSIERYRNEILGYNSRLDALQAAVLRVKLPHVASYNEARRAVAQRYWDLLAPIEGVVAPEVVPGHVFHQYTIRVLGRDRDAVQARMKELGVTTMLYYPVPQDRLPVYAGQYPTFERNETLSRQVLSLPIWPQITEDQQRAVADALARAMRGE